MLCEAIAEGPAFTGMRHFLFVVPLLAVLAGIGFDAILTALSPRRWIAAGATAALALCAGTAMPASWSGLHPYEYLYYNQLVGGLEGAQRRYEMDYWVNMMPEAVRGLQDYLGLAKEQSQSASTQSAFAARNFRSTIMPTSVCR